MKREKRQLRKKKDWQKIQLWLTRATQLSGALLNIHAGIKRREPVYTGMGVANIVQTLATWQTKKEYTPHDELKSQGFRCVFNDLYLSRFVYHTLQQLDIPFTYTPLGRDRDGKAKESIVTYNLEGTNLYMFFNGDYLSAIWSKSAQEATDAFSKTVRDSLGQYISLSVAMDNWQSWISLGQYKPQLTAYVSPVDINDFCSCVDKFHDKGLNRASLLSGPPGTGKTTFASLVAEKLGRRLLVIESNPLRKIISTGLKLRQLVDIVQPEVVLFDDIDRVPNPEQLFGEMEQLNRIEREHKLLILGSVNDLGSLPDALRRPGRFDEILEFELPEEPLREAILSAHLKDQSIRLKDEYVHTTATISEGLSGAELREIALQISIRGYNKDFLKKRVEHICKMKQIKYRGPSIHEQFTDLEDWAEEEEIDTPNER